MAWLQIIVHDSRSGLEVLFAGNSPRPRRAVWQGDFSREKCHEFVHRIFQEWELEKLTMIRATDIPLRILRMIEPFPDGTG